MWLMIIKIVKIYLEKQLLTNHYVIKHLILLKIHKMVDAKRSCVNVYKFCDRKLATHSGTLITSNSDSKNQQSEGNCTSQLLENLRNVNYIHPYMTIFGVQI